MRPPHTAPLTDGVHGGSHRSASGADVGGVVVVIPVHDEERHLGACLISVLHSLAHPEVRHLRSVVVVALDACRDGSAAIAERLLRPTDVIVEVERRNVGVARAIGTERGLAGIGLDPSRVWLAHTDADCEVPADWVAGHLAVSPTADGVAGVVRVRDWTPHLASTRLRFEHSYREPLDGPHPHVHGANLGVRASAYVDVGGFPPLACSEDHALWHALRSGGHPVVATRRIWVATSARRQSRAAGGFADTLLALEGERPGADPVAVVPTSGPVVVARSARSETSPAGQM